MHNGTRPNETKQARETAERDAYHVGHRRLRRGRVVGPVPLCIDSTNNSLQAMAR
jgi:hypothetical protein